mmetsp:Transcript_17876/g.56067  ORF Transcript_17876/g.56067 Transcript_17876/m.56067 type:complete len:297 (-) Transcript_17876:69-959(-)
MAASRSADGSGAATVVRAGGAVCVPAAHGRGEPSHSSRREQRSARRRAPRLVQLVRQGALEVRLVVREAGEGLRRDLGPVAAAMGLPAEHGTPGDGRARLGSGERRPRQPAAHHRRLLGRGVPLRPTPPRLARVGARDEDRPEAQGHRLRLAGRFRGRSGGSQQVRARDTRFARPSRPAALDRGLSRRLPRRRRRVPRRLRRHPRPPLPPPEPLVLLGRRLHRLSRRRPPRHCQVERQPPHHARHRGPLQRLAPRLPPPSLPRDLRGQPRPLLPAPDRPPPPSPLLLTTPGSLPAK